MKIGIDAREFKKGVYTGLRTILRDLLDNIDPGQGHELVLFCNQHTDAEGLPSSCEKVVIKENNTFLWDQLLLPLALRREKVQVFYSPYVKTPLWRVCPYVNTICDVIPLKVPKNKGFMGFLEKVYFSAYSFICGQRAVKVITLSKDARDKVSKAFGIGPEKLEVVYPAVVVPEGGPGPQDLLSKYGASKPYFLYVGNFKPHKNLKNLVNAYELLPGEVKDRYRLLLVGGSERELGGMKDWISGRGLRDKIIPVPNVDTRAVHAFIREADIFVFPSLAEGFGIPPVEAMASGVPVASSDLAPMTETLGDAAVFFDPNSPEDISKALIRLLDDDSLRNKCIEKGRERASVFNAKVMAEKIMRIIKDAGREKTLCISSEFPPVRGGIATHIYNLWSRLPRDEVAILTSRPGSGDQDKGEGMDVIRKSYPLGSDIVSRTIRAVTVIWHVLRQNSVRNIKKNHCGQVLSAGLAGLLVKKVKGTPYAVYMYSADVLEFSRNFLTNWIMRNVIAGSEHVIANSIFTKSLITGRGLAPEDKITVSTPGVDTGMFSPDKGDGGVKEKYGIPEGKKVLLTVSRLAERKGHENVIKALSEVLKDFSDVVYVIVGDGPTRRGLEVLVKKLHLENNVIFTGGMPFDKLVFFDNACDIFIMVPRYIEEKGDVEGFGIVFLEANACGKPVIAGRSGGVAEAVADGSTGILVDPEDVAGIRDAMLTLLRDEGMAARLGANGLARVREDFNWASRAEELKRHI